jgi:O-antigen/teichoic acid export membrane protein
MGNFVIDTIASYYRTRFQKGSFGHNVLVMFTGTAIGQFGGVILAPVLTRIYSPEMFGVLGFFTAAVSIASVVATLRYEMALPVTESEDDAANLLAVCMVALLGMTTLGFLVLWALPTMLLGMLGPYRWLLPIGFFAIGAYQAMVNYATRQGAFGIIAHTKIYQGTIGPLSQIGFAFLGAGAWGLITGFIIGQSAGVSVLFSRLVLFPRVLGNVSLVKIKAIAKRFRRFPLVSSWSGLLEAAGSSYLLLVAIPLLYSNTIAGFVFLTDRIIGRPLLLISTSILQVYIGDIAKTMNTNVEAMHQRFLHLAGYQCLIVGFWLAVVNLAAPTLFPVLFGEEWRGAVPYLQILSIAYFPQMVMHALVHTLQIMERQVMSAIWEGGRFIAVCAAFLAGYAYDLSASETLLAYSIVQALAQILLFLLMYHSIQSLRKEYSHG